MMDDFCRQFMEKHKKVSGYCPRVKKTVPATWCLDVCRGNFQGDINENGYAKIESETEPVDDESIVSAIICSRNDPDINNTIENLKKTAGGELEIVVVIDGPADAPQDEAVQLLRLNEPIGFRKAMNIGACLAKGDYLFFVDAHCRMSLSWDLKLKEITNSDTISFCTIQSMDNASTYTFARLDSNLEVKWWGKKPDQTEHTVEQSMAFTGCGWIIKKSVFIELGGAEEALGEYGYTGSEWSLKFQLSKPGRRILLRKDVICRHRFGTNEDSKLYKPNAVSPDDFRHWALSKWGGGIEQLFRQFNQPYERKFKTIIRCVDGACPKALEKECLEQLQKAAGEHRIITVQKPPKEPRSSATYYRQLLTGLSQVEDVFIWIAEQDVLYDESHFAFEPTDEQSFFCDANYYRLTGVGYCEGYAGPFSMFVAPRKLLIKALQERLQAIEKGWKPRHHEPGKGDPKTSFNLKFFSAQKPSIDIRHGFNFTGDRTCDNPLKSVEPWGDWRMRRRMLGINVPFSRKELILRFTEAMKQAKKDGFRPVSWKTYWKRARICRKCEHKNKASCGVCGCQLWLKMALDTWHCPKEKW